MRTIPELAEGTHRAKATGTLPNGKPVVVNADGTVSAVAETTESGSQAIGTAVDAYSSLGTQIGSCYDINANRIVVAFRVGSAQGRAIVGTVSGTSISFGTSVVFEGATNYNSLAYDPVNQKVVIAYEDDADADKGKAVVGTVDPSNNSISFGTISEFSASAIKFSSITYDTAAGKFVIAYRGASNYGRARVATVSGTSISFGTEVVFKSAATDWISTAYDESQSKAVISYRQSSGYSIVGTVSGTDISFGSEVQLPGSPQAIGSCYHSFAKKIVVTYRDGGDSVGKSIVGTVSGTDISFGSAVAFASGGTAVDRQTVPTYDQNARRVVVCYSNAANSSYGYVTVGTVSGSSISFGTAVYFELASTNDLSGAYDSTAQKVVISYRDVADAGKPKALVFQAAYSNQVTNLTSENYIGMSTGGTVADTGNATIDIVGTVNKEQSGLTAGQQYYVQTDGTVGTTPADPSVLAGTAISATSLVVKT